VNRHIKKSLIFILILLVLTGCWDRVEIEERGFVLGIGVDSIMETDMKMEKGKPPIDENFVKLTYQVVIPAGLGSPTQGGGDKQAYHNISEEGSSAFEITRMLAGELSRTPFLEHLKVIVFSKDAVSQPYFFSNVLDYYLRDHEMRRSMKIFISDTDAEKMLDFKPINESIPSLYIDSLSENFYKNAEIMEPVRIGDIHEKLLGKRSFMIPILGRKDEIIAINGGAVFHGHNDKMVGRLSSTEFVGVNLANGKVEGGYIEAGYKGNLFVLNVKNSKSKLSGNVNDKNNLNFTFKINVKGDLAESFTPKSLDLQNKQVMDNIEKAIEAEIKSKVHVGIEKLQKDLSADVLKLNEYIIRKNYDLWEQIKNDWDHGENYFAQSKINVEVTVDIIGIGSIIHSSRESRE
jgi:spore germination protein